MKLITRQSYLDQLLAVKDIPDIKIITGIRRSGKSKLMDAFASLIAGEDTHIIRINLNLKKFEALLDADELYAYVQAQYQEGKKNYLFIDEIQMCQGFEQAINSLYEEELFDIYLTGSNAFLLSSDLATLFGGRVFEVSMYPFSFKEFLSYFAYTDIDQAFDRYVKQGGMAGSYLYTGEDAYKYIRGILQTTITKDIIQKFGVTQEDLLVMIEEFLMDNISNRTSIRNIATKLTSSTYKTNDKTVAAYISYLCRSFLFYPCKRYDIKGKKYLESDKKYYLADLSFRFAMLGTKNTDYGYLYENIVALELMRRGYEVYVGQLYKKEVDFVVRKNGYIQYVQVSDDISRETTFEREVTSLLSIKDAYPKILIARTKHEESIHEGIRIIDIARWLAHPDIISQF